MTAKEMFEELGYKLNTNEDIMYEKCLSGEVGILAYVALNEFDTFDGVVFTKQKTYNFEEYEKSYVVSSTINVKLHQAINQQMKELNWL